MTNSRLFRPCSLQLPTTVIPDQVLKIVGAGIALSPYQHDPDYSQTSVRQRYLWLEFSEPVKDPNDTCFARVLGYAPDPLLSFCQDKSFIHI